MEVDIIVMLAFLLFGLYCLYTAFRLHNSKELFDSGLLYPGKCDKESCQDPEGFMAYMKPRLTILGSVLFLVGVYYIIAGEIPMPKAVGIVQLVITGAALLWGVIFYRTAFRRFW